MIKPSRPGMLIIVAVCLLAGCIDTTRPIRPAPTPGPALSGGTGTGGTLSGGGGGGGGGVTPTPAPTSGAVSGTWVGGYTTASTDLVSLKLNQATDGTVTAVWIETPAVNPNNVDQKLLGTGSYKASSLQLAMRDGNGAAAESFTATVSADGKTMTGFLAVTYQVVLTRQ